MIARSASDETIVGLVAELFAEFGSAVALPTVATPLTLDPSGVPDGTLATIVKEAELPEASVASVQLTEPVAPTAGFVQLSAGPEL